MGAAFSKDLKEGWHYVTGGVTHIFDSAVLDAVGEGEKVLGTFTHIFAEADQYAFKEFSKFSTEALKILVPDVMEPLIKGFLTDFDNNHLIRKVYRSTTIFIATAILVKILSITKILSSFTKTEIIDIHKHLHDLPKDVNYFELNFKESRDEISKALANTRSHITI